MRLELDSDEPLVPFHTAVFYPIDTGDSLKGFCKESDISSPVLCF